MEKHTYPCFSSPDGVAERPKLAQDLAGSTGTTVRRKSGFVQVQDIDLVGGGGGEESSGTKWY